MNFKRKSIYFSAMLMFYQMSILVFKMAIPVCTLFYKPIFYHMVHLYQANLMVSDLLKACLSWYTVLRLKELARLILTTQFHLTVT